MFVGVNGGGGRRTRLCNNLLCARRPLSHIYRWEGGRSSQKRRPSRRNPTWSPSQAAPLPALYRCGEKAREGAPPFPFSHERERQEGLALPLFLPLGPAVPRRGAPGAALFPLCPIRPISLSGVA